MARARFQLAAMIVVMAAIVETMPGCGPVEGAPELSALTFLGTDPDHPWTLLMRVDVADAEGDLDGGTFILLLDGAEVAELPLSELLEASGLDPDAVFGTLSFRAELAFDVAPATGHELRVAITVSDAAGHFSNTPELTLALSYP